MLSAFGLGSRLFPRTWNILMLVAMLAVWGVATPARAQTAQFTGAVATLGGGFSFPEGVAVDGSGNVYVANTNNSTVKEIPAGCASSSCVTTLGGGFAAPTGVAVDGSGNVYVADYGNSTVKEIPAGCASSSCVTTLGGGFNHPEGVAVDGSGNVYVADYGNGTVKEIPAGCASSSCILTLGGEFAPTGVAVDGSGNIYVADYGNGTVDEMPAGCAFSSCVTTLGSGFNRPYGVAVDGSGNVYVGDPYDGMVKEIPTSCINGANSSSCVLTLGGGFGAPEGVAVGGSGNVYVADTGNSLVKEIMLRGVNFGSAAVHAATPATQTLYFTFTNSTPAAIGAPVALTMGACASTNPACGNPTSNPLDFAVASGGTCTSGSTFSAGQTCSVNVAFTPQYAGTRKGAVELTDSSGAVIATALVYGSGTGPQVVFNSPATADALGGGVSEPTSVAVDGSGNVYVADGGGNAVKEIPTGCTSLSCVKTLGGGFVDPNGVAVDGSGNVYVADFSSQAVEEIPPGCASSSCVTTLGIGFVVPYAVAVDGSGNVYIADYVGHAVKEIPSGCASSGCVKILGSGFDAPTGVAVDGGGNVYIVDAGNNTVKEIPPGCASSSCVNTLGGGFNSPYGVAVDGSGNAYIVDSSSKPVKEIPSGCTTSSCVMPLDGIDSTLGVAVDGGGNLYVLNNSAVQEINRATPMSLNFANTAAGSTSSDSPQTVMLQNIGNQPLSFPVPTSGNNPSIAAGFTLDNATTCPMLDTSSGPGTLASGAICTLEVDFQPTLPGYNSGVLNITDTNLNAVAPSYAVQSVSLSGNGIIPPAVHVSQPVLSYGMGGTISITFSGGGCQPDPTGTVTYSIDGGATQTATITGGVASLPLPATLSGGNHTIAWSYSGDTDYAGLSSQTITQTISAVTLTITANNATRVYGTANPTFTGSVTGAVNSDSFTESFSTAATVNSAPGSYSIVPSVAGANLSSYTVTPTDGTLSVTKAATTTVLSASASTVSPGQNLTLTATVSSATTGTPTGVVTFFDGATQLGTEMLSGGAASYTTSTLAPGVTHSLTASYAGDTNFLASTSASTVSVPVVNLTFSLTPTGGQSQTVAPGSTANYLFQITPTFGVYPGAVSFSVSGLPQGATATFTPPTIAANGGPQTVTMTIQTPGTTPARSHDGSLFRRGAPLALGFLLLPLFGVRKRKRWVRMFSVALLVFGAAAFTGLASGCGTANGFFGHQQKSYSVTVTATGGTVSQATVVTLNIE